MTWRHATLERPGCVVHYWLQEHSTAPLVVLCHAALTDHTFFTAMATALASAYRPLTWDIRGHGMSRPLQGPFTVPDAAEDALAIIAASDVERAVIVGQGMGSFVAQEVTFRRPDLVEALVVIGGRSIASVPRAGGRSLPEPAGLMKVMPFVALRHEAVVASAQHPSSREYLSGMLAHLTKHEYLKVMEGVSRYSGPEAGGATRAPTLLIRGELDENREVRESMTEWALREPHVEYRVVAGAGHCAGLDRPEVVNHLVLEFLERHRTQQLPGSRHVDQKEATS